MITENLSTLKIHKLTRKQYERELEAGRLDKNVIYLTPYESEYATQEYVDNKIAEIPTPDVSGQIGSHNTATNSHNDIRLLVQGLTTRLNALADSDDTTLDQMSELVAYIKSNKTLIEEVTTNKVNVSDIINDLTTNVTNKPLSAAQGVALKALIDAITVPTKVSAFENDKGYLTAVPSEYVTETELTAKGYLTEHQSLDAYAKTSDIPTKVSQLTNDSNFTTKTYVDNSIAAIDVPSGFVAQAEAPTDKSVLWVDVDDETEESSGVPVRGIDYWTEADKAEIVAEVVDFIKIEYPNAHVIYGDVDDNNIITIYGELASGTYTLKYEAEDGSTVDIGDLVLDNTVYYSVTNNLTQCTNSNSATEVAEGESYSATITAKSGYELESVAVTMGGQSVSVSGGTISIASVTGNIVITAVAEEAIVEPSYTNVLNNYTHHLNKRYSSSSGGLVDCNGMLHMYVPVADVWNKTIRFRGLTDKLQASNNNPSWFATNASFGNLGSVQNKVLYNCPTYSYANGIMSIGINATAFGGNDYSHAAYLTVTVAVNQSAAITEASLANIIMTIDEEITD